MASIEVKGTADFSSITKEVKKLAGTISDNFGSEGFQIFDEDTVAFLKTEAHRAFGKIHVELKKLVSEAKNLDAELQSIGLTEEKQNILTTKKYETLKKITSLSRDLRKIKEGETRLSRAMAGTEMAAQGKGGMLSRVGRVLSPATSALGSVQGVGTAVKMGSAMSDALKGGAVSTGAGIASAIGLGAVAAAAVAAAKAISNMITSASYFSEQIPTLLQGSAIGLGPSISERSEMLGTDLGFGIDETLKTRLEAARAFGTSRSVAGQENLVGNIQSAGRALGIDPGEITGAGNQLRSTMGVKGAETSMAQILSKAFEQGLDKSQATHLLQSTVGALSEINQNGLMSDEAVINTIGNLTKNGMMSPEQAARTVTSMDAAMKGSQGTARSFFQMSAARAGIGGGNLFGAEAAVQQGLVGVEKEKYLKQTGGNKRGMEVLESMGLVGGGEYTKKLIGQQLKDVDFMYGTEKGVSKEARVGRRAAKGRFLGDAYGVKGVPEQQRLLAIMEKIDRGTATKKEEEEMQDMSKDSETKWRDDALKTLNNLPGDIAKALAELSAAKFRGGEALAENITAKLIQADTLTYKGTNKLIEAGNEMLNPGGNTPKPEGFGWLYGKNLHSETAKESMGIGEAAKVKGNKPVTQGAMELALPEDVTNAIIQSAKSMKSVEKGLSDSNDARQAPKASREK